MADREHIYLFAYACILLAMFLVYVYVCEHREQIIDNKEWKLAFLNAGMTKEDLPFVEHDPDVWFYRGVNTCVGYGNFNEECDYRMSVCAGNPPPNSTFGTREQQAQEVVEAIKNGGSHSECPLIYPSGE